MTEADVVIVGAGPAGLAAALALADSGLTILHLEARDRIGGRSLTVNIGRRRGIDIGAHWLHASRANPLTREAKRLGIALNSADKWPIIIDGDEILGIWGQMRLWRAWRKIDRAIIRLAADQPDAAADLAVDRHDRWQVLAGELHGNHACGTALANISVEDFSNALDSEDRFVEGGFGALVAAAASSVSPRLGVTVTSIRQSPQGVVVGASAGDVSARAVLLTIPTTLIANGSIAIEPGLPESHMEAAHDLPHGAYERLVFTLGDDPFREDRDRAVILLNDRSRSFYMLAGGGGRGVHFADFGGEEARQLAAAGIDAMAEVVADWLDLQVGSDAARSLKPLYASRWSGDPLSLGGWSVARPGRARARLALRAPVAERIWFAGEATSTEQWGTVGGAWLEGRRAASEIRRFLTSRCHLPSVADLIEPGGRRPHKARPRNLT
ncbi:MAG: FAD-dependent oxidoreductase [Methylocystis sp.]|nr:FAD-dependent oxidoreductase [Methylocystis sp.]MCA3582793.1 FAD-dependent oxidoreductase [Methylocystis sp.]MCA3589550.1 FAD-dependent oxidoreductase [Methylocystis sp.]MCA3592090.1 FAD-dependent oxidoreductase [Methylocystis sp.]